MSVKCSQRLENSVRSGGMVRPRHDRIAAEVADRIKNACVVGGDADKRFRACRNGRGVDVPDNGLAGKQRKRFSGKTC